MGALPIDRELAYGVRRNAVLQKLTSYPLATFVCDDKQHHKLMAVDVRESPRRFASSSAMTKRKALSRASGTYARIALIP